MIASGIKDLDELLAYAAGIGVAFLWLMIMKPTEADIEEGRKRTEQMLAQSREREEWQRLVDSVASEAEKGVNQCSEKDNDR